MTAPISRRGRPLRFLALVSVLWIAMRVAILWPRVEPAAQAASPVSKSMTVSLPPHVAVPVAQAAPVAEAIPAGRAAFADPPPARRSVASLPAASAPPVPATIPAIAAPFVARVEAPFAASSRRPIASAQVSFAAPTDRWSASAWLMLRPGGTSGIAPGGQLGGSQAGVRLVYMLVPKRRIALFGRVASPLSGPGREATLGVEWQPTRAPVRLVAEQRFAIDGGKSGPGLGLVGGFDRDIAGFRLETYGQAGAIRRSRIEPYADGAARLTRRIGHSGIAIGAGVWGGAQRDAQRLDIGPSATLSLPVARHRFRFALDWRQRVAGSARPGSGVALTLGSDF